MQEKKLSNLGNVIKIFLEVMSIIGIIILIMLYPITKIVHVHYDLFVVMIYPCGICFLYIVYQFIKLFDTLKINKPFCMENVKRFKNSMVSSFIISILVIIALLFTIILYNYYSLQLKVALLFISILFFAAGVAFYILSELFMQATLYKEVNDLTI